MDTILNIPQIDKKYEYSEREQEKIFEYIGKIQNPILKTFLHSFGLPTSGNKHDLEKRIKEAVLIGKINFSDLTKFLDSSILCDKQHIYLYDGSEQEIKKWQDNDYVENQLLKYDLEQFKCSYNPIILPKSLELSNINYDSLIGLDIIAIIKKISWERNSDLDEIDCQIDGDVRKDAYVQILSRGVIKFSWSFSMNYAQLQISQMPTKISYEEIEESFFSLIGPWFPHSSFTKVKLNPVISKLLDNELNDKHEIRSHGLGYQTIGGRKVVVNSPSAKDSVCGEIDPALNQIRNIGIGQSGNFYWLPKQISPANNNCLEEEIHTIINGEYNRINFKTPNKKSDIDYVLSRVRTLCK